jgi:hypothetical protein
VPKIGCLFSKPVPSCSSRYTGSIGTGFVDFTLGLGKRRGFLLFLSLFLLALGFSRGQMSRFLCLPMAFLTCAQPKTGCVPSKQALSDSSGQDGSTRIGFARFNPVAGKKSFLAVLLFLSRLGS